MNGRTWFWIVIFTAFAILATVFLMSWASPRPGLWGFPSWIFPFIGIHLAFTVSVWGFTKWFWKEQEETEEE